MNTGTAVITGASSGLGLQCARALLRRDASWHVVLAVRDPARGRAAMEELGEPNRCSVLEVDLASVRSVRSFVETVRTTPLPPIRALVCNAGLQVVSGIAFTDDGVEMTFGVNHLGHFALVTGILDWLARPARIVVVSSGTHDPSKHTGMPTLGIPAPPTSRTRPPIRTRRPKAPSIHHVQAVQRALHLRARPPPRSRRTGRDGQRVRPRPNAGLRLGPRLSADPATGVPSPVADAARPSLRSQHPGLRRTPGGAGGRSAVRGRDGPIFRGRQGDPVFRRVLRSGKGARPLGDQ